MINIDLELIFRSGLQQGFIWGILVIGVFISFRILDIADLSIEGVFPLGACIASLLIYFNVNPLVATIISFFGGTIGGLITGILHTKCKIPAILSGIITMTALSSINLIILGISSKTSNGLATLAFKNDIYQSFAKMIDRMFSLNGISKNDQIIISVFVVSGFFLIVSCVLIYWFFGTEIGMNIRATGNNQKMARAQGINTNKMIILGLMISNGLIALSGALFSQDTGNAITDSGKGAIVNGLAAIILGEIIFGKKRSFKTTLFSIIVGTVIFFVVKAFAIELQVSYLLNLVVAIIIAIVLSLPLIKKKFIGGSINA